MKILFTSDSNGHNYKDPIAFLVETQYVSDEDLFKADMETSTRFSGGIYSKILQKLNLNYTDIRRGRLSQFKKEEYDKEYRCSSGNY